MGSVAVGLPRHHVPRDRLVSQLLEGAVGVVEAGAGYGKSVLAAEYRAAAGLASAVVSLGPRDDDPATLVSSLHRALRVARLSDLAGAIAGADPGAWPDRLLDVLSGTSEPLLLVLDDVHHVHQAGTSAQILHLARNLPGWHRLLLLARTLPPQLEPARRLSPASYLDTAALALTAGEAARLWAGQLGQLPGDHDVRALLEVTGGWVTAVLLAIPALRQGHGDGAAGLRAGTDVITALVDAVLEALAEPDRAGAAQLAHLPWLTHEIADEIAGQPGLLHRLATAGIPLIRAGAGRWELPSPVTAALAARAPLNHAAAGTAARVYARAGDVPNAVRVLAGAGAAERAAVMLAGLSPAGADDLGFAEVRNLVETLPGAAVAGQPRVLVHLARTAETAHQDQVRRTALERAIAATSGAYTGAGLRREVQAEWARHLMWDERTRDEAAALARSVLDSAGAGELVARARALDLLGRLSCALFSGAATSAATSADAERFLTEAARLARRIGQPVWAAQALVPLATAVYHEGCRFGLALATLDQALAGLPPRSRYRALTLSFRSDVLTALGRFAEAETAIEEARALGRATGERWALAMASWSEALLASFTGDRARTVRAVTDTESHRDSWFEQSEGVEWLANAADALDRVGEHRLAAERLGQARRRAAGYERPVVLFGAAVLGRSGDPHRAEEAIASCLTRADLTPLDRWPLLLLRAYAALRRNDPAVGRLAAEAFDTCRALGHPDGPLLRERAVAQALLPAAVAAGSSAAADLMAHEGRLSVSLLGGFEVRRGGAVLGIPPGRPAAAVRAVAAAGGRMTVDELLEVIWPGTDPGVGRNRLRNLLSRVRAAAGELLARDGEVIRLEPAAEVDAAAFEAAARQALSATHGSAAAGPEAAGLARSALARYRGELLPDDRYEAWAARPRERLRGMYLELLDLIAADAEQRGEFDEAIRQLRRAIEAEPGDEDRHVRLARLLAAQGRAGSARTVVRQATAALEELGLPVSAALRDLARTLGEPVRS